MQRGPQTCKEKKRQRGGVLKEGLKEDKEVRASNRGSKKIINKSAGIHTGFILRSVGICLPISVQ